MSQRNRKNHVDPSEPGSVDPSEPGSVYLRGTSTVSLNERFSQVLVDQLTRSRMRTLDPVLVRQKRGRGAPQVVVLVRRDRSPPLDPQTRGPSVEADRCVRRRSVWSRLGWRRVTRRPSTSGPRGFWSFRNKYRWRRSFTSSCSGRADLHRRPGRRRLLRARNTQKLTAGRTRLQRGGATSAFRGRGRGKGQVPTRKQLDEQLDKYMSMSKSRLDAQLDEYMSMAGQTYWD